MEQLLILFGQVGDIIIRAVPAFIAFILIHLYLKKVLFQPLERVLAERRAKTQGAVEASEAIVREATGKADRYEQALSQARAGISRDHEAARREFAAGQAKVIADARRQMNEKIAEARAGIEAEAAQAQAGLELEAELLAERITGSILAGRN
jgi:F-type H+-transporting ATPase subunit b